MTVTAYTALSLISTVCSSDNRAQKTQHVNRLVIQSVAIALSFRGGGNSLSASTDDGGKIRKYTDGDKYSKYLYSIPTLDHSLVFRLTRTSPFHSGWLPIGISLVSGNHRLGQWTVMR